MNSIFGVGQRLARSLIALLGCVLLTSVGAAPGTVSYQYDDAGRLKSSVYADGTATLYSQDSAGNRTQTQTGLVPVLQFSAATASVSEATTPFTVNVSRVGASAGTASVSYATANGSAAAGSDYTASSGTLSWAAGDVAPKTISVPIANDSSLESDETFSITLSNPSSGAVVGNTAQVTVTILDNDSSASFAIDSVSARESEGLVTFTVTKTGVTAVTHAVTYQTNNGTASAGSDYVATGGTLTFASNETSKTFTVDLVSDDADYEADETFTVTLSNPTNGATIGAGTGTAVIINDDLSRPVVSARVVSSSEIELSWPAITGGSGNYVYWPSRGTTSLNYTYELTKLDYGLEAGTTYTYTVMAADSGWPYSIGQPSDPVTATTAPAAPEGLYATPSSNQILVQWVAPYSEIGIASYKVYREGALVGTRTTADFTDTAVAPGAGYHYTVVAYDTQGSPSVASEPLFAIAQPAPTVLTASVVSSSQINLSWNPLVNGSGNYLYHIYRDNVHVTYIYTNTWSDTGLAPGTTHTYKILAVDSGYSMYWDTSNAVTLTTAPAAPSDFDVLDGSPTHIDLTWTAPYSQIGIAGYRVYRNGVLLNGSVGGTSYSDTTVAANTQYTYAVEAYDTAGSTSTRVSGLGSTGISAPVLSGSVVSASQIYLSWGAVTGGTGPYAYHVYRNNYTDISGIYYSTSITDSGLQAGTTYSYNMMAADASPPYGISPGSNVVTLTTAPNAPTGLSASGVSTSQINLSWAAPYSQIGIAGYRIYRDGNYVTSTSATSYSDTGLSASSGYTYTVSAYDTANHSSVQSSGVTGYTQAAYVPKVNVHRNYHSGSGEHFYSLDPAEGPNAGFNYEGARFSVLASSPAGSSPIYRCYYPARGKHFIALNPECDWAPGVINEGTYGYVYDSPIGGSEPLYRFFNPGNGDSLATTDYNEGANNGYYNDALLGYVPPAMGTEQLAVYYASIPEYAGTLSIPISRTWGTSGAASVTCTPYTNSSGDGIATPGVDFDATPVTLYWSDGDGSTQYCNIPIYDDGESEGYWWSYYDPWEGMTYWYWAPGESFLISVSGATTGYPLGMGVMIDDNE